MKDKIKEKMFRKIHLLFTNLINITQKNIYYLCTLINIL